MFLILQNTIRRKIWAAVAVVCAAGWVSGCGEEDLTQAKKAVSWMRMHKHDGRANQVWKITDLKIESAKKIVVEVFVSNEDHADAISSQSLMRQSLIAKYACPPDTAEIWQIVKDDIQLRVNLNDRDGRIANTICVYPDKD